MYPEYMKNSQHQNWIEDIAMLVNKRNLIVCDRTKMIETLIVETEYNRFQLQKAYRIIYTNGEIDSVFNAQKYLKQ